MGAVSTFAAAERWRRTSDRFVLAARALADDATLAVPRARLLGGAAELRLKGYLHATRGGAPETRDLPRLISLAMQCGLVLTPAEKACVRQLQAAQAAEVTSPVVLPSNQVDGLFAAIDAQCGSGEQGVTPPLGIGRSRPSRSRLVCLFLWEEDAHDQDRRANCST